MNNCMKKSILFFLLFGSLSIIKAQSFDRSVIGSTGGNYNFTGGSISSTLGEVVIATVQNSNFTLTQGFQQNHYGNLAVSSVSKIPFRIWPNPTQNVLNFNSEVFIQEMSYEIVDMSGKVVLSGNLQLNQIDVSSIAEGAYQVRLNLNNEVAIAKFIKLSN